MHLNGTLTRGCVTSAMNFSVDNERTVPLGRITSLRLLEEIAVATNELSGVDTVFRFALKRVCAYTRAAIGHVFMADRDAPDRLVTSGLWEGKNLERYQDLQQATRDIVFKPGEGLPGRAMAGRRIETLDNLAADPRFSAVRTASSLRGIAFPVLAGEEVVAIFEFFSARFTPLDQELLDTLLNVGTLLGRAVERQRSEEALRSSEVLFRTIFQGSAIGIELVDLEGNLLAFNPAVCRIFGLSEDELRHQALGNSHHPGNAVAWDQQFRRLAAGETDEYTVERIFRHKEGSPVWGRSTVSLVRNLDGNPQYAICMIEDISEHKQMEADVAEMHRRLMEGREEERVRLAQEIHDGPIQDLYALLFSLQAYYDKQADQSAAAPLMEIQKGLQDVVGTLRSMSSELRPSALTPFGLAKAIQSHAEEFQETHPELIIRLNLAPDGQRLPEMVRLALFRIYQVSLVNVLRHAEARHVFITLELSDEAVCLTVKDDGKGFAVPARWIQFVRKGHLGLVGAVERAEAVGGRLEVRSSADEGTTIRVDVPLVNPAKL